MLKQVISPAVLCLAVAGCNLGRSDLKKTADGVTPAVYNANEQPRGRVLEPKYCNLGSAIVTRPLGDHAIDAAAWEAADVQNLPADARKLLEDNGIRVGIITGNLPAELTDLFNKKPGQPETQWVQLALPEGERTSIVVGSKVPETHLLLNRKGSISGRKYQDAEGRLLVTPSHAGSTAVSIKLAPAIHHGEYKRTISAAESNSQFAEQQFQLKEGQQEDLLREMTLNVLLEPGQTLVIGCRSEQKSSLGSLLFTRPDGQDSTQVLQSLLLVQASRNHLGELPGQKLEQPGELPELSVTPTPIPSAASSKDSKAP